MDEENIDIDEVIINEDDLFNEQVSAKRQAHDGGRMLVEEKLEELRLQRLTQEYDFS